MPFPASPINGQIYTNAVGTKFKYFSSENKWQVVGGPTYAEVSSASNQGAGGVGIFKQKTLGDLEFKNINAGSPKVSITDDTGNDEVDIDVVEAQVTHDNLNGLSANNHHNQVHDLNGADHSPASLDWSKVNKTGSSLLDLAFKNHSDLQSVLADQHHSQQHELNGSDHLTTTALDWSKVNKAGSNLSEIITRNHSDLQNVTSDQHHSQLHASTHEPGGGDAMTVDAVPATGSLRTLGTGAQQASAGNHSHSIVKEYCLAGTEYNSNYGNYRTRSIGAVASQEFTFKAPDDMISLISVHVCYISPTSITGGTFTITSSFAGLGEIYTQHSGSYSDTNFTSTANLISSVDITSAFTGLSAGDIVGFNLAHSGMATVHYLGLVIKYNAQVQ